MKRTMDYILLFFFVGSSLLFFGLAGMAVVYFMEPWFYSVTKRIPAGIQKISVLLLLLLSVLDVAASGFNEF